MKQKLPGLLQSIDIQAQQSPLHGQGVFALRDFMKGEVIEVAPVIRLKPSDRELLGQTIFFNYYFLVDDAKTPLVAGLGLSSLYNHSAPSNAVYSISLKEQYIKFTAHQDIEAGDEITINYNGDPDDLAVVEFEEPNAEDLAYASPRNLPPDEEHAETMHSLAMLQESSGLYIKDIKGKGRGVFSVNAIAKDEIIECCPMVIMPARDRELAVQSSLSDYLFTFIKEDQTMTLVLGFGSIYNHATIPNATYQMDPDLRLMFYTALTDIPAGEEICINYANEPGESYEEWFAARNIRLK